MPVTVSLAVGGALAPAVVGRVEARAFEGDRHRLDQAAQLAVTARLRALLSRLEVDRVDDLALGLALGATVNVGGDFRTLLSQSRTSLPSSRLSTQIWV